MLRVLGIFVSLVFAILGYVLFFVGVWFIASEFLLSLGAMLVGTLMLVPFVAQVHSVRTRLQFAHEPAFFSFDKQRRLVVNLAFFGLAVLSLFIAPTLETPIPAMPSSLRSVIFIPVALLAANLLAMLFQGIWLMTRQIPEHDSN